ncbi:GNAT family N-acetyltransferase [Streptomyces kronopolitis]|uniref:GNAT family N-acetyltransferase n=1 Tax=Streptomyces kronopolitis TaxID=1612435 RepID=UPI0027E27ED4|nr:GNAT family N-acetyltransferase [Streptomyces kronopolitis]
MIGLRDLTMDDAPALQRIYSGASLRYVERRALTLDEAVAQVANALADARSEPRDRWAYGITADGDLLGMIRLRCRTERHATLSYLLREGSWGRGYATRAVAGMLRHAFTATGLTSVGARHHPDNPASGRVLLKNGFRYRGIRDGWPSYGIHRPGAGSLETTSLRRGTMPLPPPATTPAAPG